MSQWVSDAFRLYWGMSTLLAAAVAVCVGLAAGRGWLKFLHRGASGWTLAAMAVIAAAGAHVFLYLHTPNFIDYAEPMVALIGSGMLHGDLVYHDIRDGQSIVSSLYGPLTFLLQSLFLTVSPSIFGSKLPGVVAALALCALIFIALRRAAPGNAGLAWLGLAIVIVFLYAFRHFWFWNRPDSFLLLTTAAGLVAVTTLRPGVALIALGALGGVAAGLKPHAPLYLLPLAVTAACRLPSWRDGVKPALAAAAFGLALALLPFSLMQIDLVAYVRNLATISQHGLRLDLTVQSLAYAVAFLAVPAMLLLRVSPGAASREERVLFWSLAGASAVMAVISSKPGAGAPHMAPFLPIAVFLAVSLAAKEAGDGARPVVALRAMLLAELAVFLPIWAYSVYEIRKHFPDFSRERAAAAEARDMFARYPGAEMAVGRDVFDPLIYHRVQGGFAGRILRFDVVNWMDLQRAGAPAHLVQHFVEGCRTPSWIVPARQAPFEARGYSEALFDASFRDAFARNYARTETGQFYEVWTCVGQAVSWHRPQ